MKVLVDLMICMGPIREEFPSSTEVKIRLQGIIGENHGYKCKQFFSYILQRPK